MAQRILYLVRHGQYDAASLEQDKHAGGLTAVGKQQAEALAARLAELPIGVIHHSNLRRAVETANIIHKKLRGIPMKPSRLLRECIPYPPLTVQAWMDAIPVVMLETGSKQAVQAARKFFKRTRGRDRCELLVCHGNIIRFFVTCALGAPPEHWVNMDIAHCSLAEIRVDPDGAWRLLAHNDTGHLPLPLRTF